MRPPGSTDWQAGAVGWLLDQCPADYRAYRPLTRQPAALAWLAEQHVEAQLTAMRAAYRVARTELADLVAPGDLPEVLVCLEREGLRLRAARRSLELVRAALDGGEFIPRL